MSDVGYTQGSILALFRLPERPQKSNVFGDGRPGVKASDEPPTVPEELAPIQDMVCRIHEQSARQRVCYLLFSWRAIECGLCDAAHLLRR